MFNGLRRALVILVLSLPVFGAKARAASSHYEWTSPNHGIHVGFSVTAGPGSEGLAHYHVDFGAERVVDDSVLGLTFLNSGPAENFSVAGVSHHSHSETYRLPVGKAQRIVDRYEEYTVRLKEVGAAGRRLNIRFRLYDDGVGFRYEIPRQAGFHEFTIGEERTSFRLKENPQVFAVELPFHSTFEGYYTQAKLGEVTLGSTMNLPVLVGPTHGLWLAITEAALLDYAGLNLARTDAESLSARLTPSAIDPQVKVRGQTPFASPWRVLLMARSPVALLASNIVNNLNAPTALKDVSWIHPGKVQFPWWNGYELATDARDADPSHQPGLNTWSLKRYVDFCAAHGIEYHSLDGFDQAWYGGEIGNPPGHVDLTQAIPAIDLPEVLRYGRSKGVGLRIWMDRKALRGNDMDQLFARYQAWGVEGLMIDFLNDDDQATVKLYAEIIRTAAKHHLTVNFHGSWKPTGVSRTYPNLLSQEGVMSSEYNRFNETGSPPEHEMIYAFVRQIAGPLDVHPGSFRPIAPEDWSRETAPLRAMGTLARQLAVYIVMESGAQMLVDAPAAYLANPEAFEFVKKVPVAWSETKGLAGDVGHFISVARRHGKDWYIGSMTDRQARVLDLSLDFLAKGKKFKAEIYADGAHPRIMPNEILIHQEIVTAQDRLRLELGPSGGNAVYLAPVEDP